jgi:hypothetical protein
VSGTRCTRESDEDEKWKEERQVLHACEIFFTIRRDDSCCCDAGTQVIHLRERFFLASFIFNKLAALWKGFVLHGKPLSRAEDPGRAEFLCYCTDERRFF